MAFSIMSSTQSLSTGAHDFCSRSHLRDTPDDLAGKLYTTRRVVEKRRLVCYYAGAGANIIYDTWRILRFIVPHDLAKYRTSPDDTPEGSNGCVSQSMVRRIDLFGVWHSSRLLHKIAFAGSSGGWHSAKLSRKLNLRIFGLNVRSVF